MWETIAAAHSTADEEIDGPLDILNQIFQEVSATISDIVEDTLTLIGTALGLIASAEIEKLNFFIHLMDPLIAILLSGFILMAEAFVEAFDFDIAEFVEVQKVMIALQEKMVHDEIVERAAEAPIPEPTPEPAPPAPPTPPPPPKPRPVPVPYVKPIPKVKPKKKRKTVPKKGAA